MNELSLETDLKVHFYDTDAMGIVWHGNYLKFFEFGREAFGEKYNLEYLEMYNKGFFTPIVKSGIDHKAPIYYGDKVKLITTLIPQRAAKIIFEYKIINTETDVVCAVGKTIQVFLHAKDRVLELNTPDFYQNWKDKYLSSPE